MNKETSLILGFTFFITFALSPFIESYVPDYYPQYHERMPPLTINYPVKKIAYEVSSASQAVFFCSKRFSIGKPAQSTTSMD